MLRDMYGRDNFGLIYLLAGVIALSFVLGWLGIRETETRLLRKESLEAALQWNRALLNNLENVEGFLITGLHSDHDRPLFRMATAVGGIIRHKVYNSASKVVAASSPDDIGKVNNSRYFQDIVRTGQSYVIVNEPDKKNGNPKIIAKAYLPFMSDGSFKGAFEVYVDVTSWAVHIREIGNLAIGGLFLVLGAISGVGGILIFRNIKYRLKQHEFLVIAKVKAETASREKSDFMASMSHELRTPLNAINGFSEIIEGEIFGPVGIEKYREYAKDIHDSGKLLLSLINDILDMSKAEAGKLKLHEETVSVANIVDKGMHMIKDSAAKKNLCLSAEISDSLPALYCDERLLLQTLLNFLSNAVKFTPQGGAIVVGALIVGDGDLVLTVKDTGVGIAAKDIQKVLEPFGQVDNYPSVKTEGTGLGLPLAIKFIECHGGRFDIYSTPGKGTVVSARYPGLRIVNKS